MFFKGMVNAGWGSSVVESIVAYAKSHGLITIAEQIDSAEALDNARTYGIDMVQGHYIQHPLTWSQIHENTMLPVSDSLSGLQQMLSS